MKRSTSNNISQLLEEVYREFNIPNRISLVLDKGAIRVIAATALISPYLCQQTELLLGDEKGIEESFSTGPECGVSFVGAIIAERPLIDDASFKFQWRRNGISAAVATADINPLFRDNIHRFIRVAVDYCTLNGLTCTGAKSQQQKIDHKRHADHLKPLRYFFHAPGN